MKVISLLQPWATLVVIGAKKIETRSWNTKYRGEILIHASANKNSIGKSLIEQEFFKRHLPQTKGLVSLRQYTDWNALPFGAIIGKANLTWTERTEILEERLSEKLNILIEHLMHSGNQEHAFGDYNPRRYGWMLDDAVKFDKPIPCKGALSIWECPKDIEEQIKMMKHAH